MGRGAKKGRQQDRQTFATAVRPEDRPSVGERMAMLHDALSKAAAERGYAIVHDRRYSDFECRLIEGERVGWNIYIRGRMRKVPLTKQEQKFWGDSRTWKQIVEPTEFLVVQLNADYSSIQRMDEKPRHLLHDSAEKILAKLEAMAAHAIEYKAEQAERERRRAIMRARRKQIELLEDGEEERWSELRRMAAGWNEAGRLRSFVDAVSRKLAGLKNRPARVDLWLAWARERIDALNPFLGEPEFVYESVVAKLREEERKVLSEYEREFGEPDPDEFVE
jgi:hypothetical protein